jgi:hypothetical protein
MYFPLTYSENVLSAVKRIVADCTLFPLGVATFFLNPTVPGGAAYSPSDVDQIHVPPKRVGASGSGETSATLVPHQIRKMQRWLLM